MSSSVLLNKNFLNVDSLNNPCVCLFVCLLLYFLSTTPGSSRMLWLLHFKSFSEYSRLVFSGDIDRIGSEYDRFTENSVSDSATTLLLFKTLLWVKNRLSKSHAQIMEVLIKNQSLKHGNELLTFRFCF